MFANIIYALIILSFLYKNGKMHWHLSKNNGTTLQDQIPKFFSLYKSPSILTAISLSGYRKSLYNIKKILPLD
jgi:hypothetical protein